MSGGIIRAEVSEKEERREGYRRGGEGLCANTDNSREAVPSLFVGIYCLPLLFTGMEREERYACGGIRFGGDRECMGVFGS